MEAHAKEWSVEEMAGIMKVSSSGYYRFIKRAPSKRAQENTLLTAKIRAIYEASHTLYGSPRIHAQLKQEGVQCGRPRVANLMKQAGIRAKIVKRFKVTTKPDIKATILPNQLAQNFTAAAPDEKWVADITYIATQEGWLYLAIVLDLFSRKIVGLAMDKYLHTELILQATQQALTHRQPAQGLLHHSDKGCQYTSKRFQDLLEENGIVCSMSGTGNCYDNACAESFFHTLKTEWIEGQRYETREAAIASIFEYVEVFYNNQRLHSYCGYLSPTAFENKYWQAKKQSLPSLH